MRSLLGEWGPERGARCVLGCVLTNRKAPVAGEKAKWCQSQRAVQGMAAGSSSSLWGGRQAGAGCLGGSSEGGFGVQDTGRKGKLDQQRDCPIRPPTSPRPSQRSPPPPEPQPPCLCSAGAERGLSRAPAIPETPASCAFQMGRGRTPWGNLAVNRPQCTGDRAEGRCPGVPVPASTHRLASGRQEGIQSPPVSFL